MRTQKSRTPVGVRSGLVAALCAALLSVTAFAADDAPRKDPLSEPSLIFSPDGTLAPGRSVKLDVGQTAPFAGQLLDAQEHVRREKINERNEKELADLKKGNATIAKGALIAIVVGVAVAGIGGGVAIGYALKR